jgi:hypothetical protein
MPIVVEDNYPELDVSLKPTQPKLQGGQQGINYKMYSAGPALKLGPEVTIGNVRVNCGNFNELAYPRTHLEMVPLPKQIVNVVLQRWRAKDPENFDLYAGNPREEYDIFNTSKTLCDIWSEVAQTAFGKKSRLWIGGPEQCKMAGPGMYGWRVARLRNLPRPHKPAEEEEEEGEEEAGGEQVEQLKQELAQKNAQIAEKDALLQQKEIIQGVLNNRLDALRNILRDLEELAVERTGDTFYSREENGVFTRKSRWDRLEDIEYQEDGDEETFTFRFKLPPRQEEAEEEAQPQAQQQAQPQAQQQQQAVVAYKGGYTMPVERGLAIPPIDIASIKARVNVKKEYAELLTGSPLEKFIQQGALVQDAVILPWSVITKISNMTQTMFFSACKSRDESADKPNRVIDPKGAKELVGYKNQGDGGRDVYGVLNLDGASLPVIKEALKGNYPAKKLNTKTVLAFISCNSAKNMEQTIQLNKLAAVAQEPWLSVKQSGDVPAKDKIYEIDTVCSRSDGGKKRLGPLLMLWAWAQKLNSDYLGTALKVVRLAISTNEGVTYHGPPDIQVANLYHEMFKYQRAFPFPPQGSAWHTTWTEEIPGYNSRTVEGREVGTQFWENASKYFDQARPSPYVTEDVTYSPRADDAENTFNRKEYWMYRPYPTEDQIESIAANVIKKIMAPPPPAAAQPPPPPRRRA